MKQRIKASLGKSMTIEEAFNEFIYEKRALNKSAETIRSYEGSYKRWSEYLLEQGMSFSVSNFTSSYVISFASSLLKAQMNPATLNSYLRHLRAFAYWCSDKEYIKPFKVKLVAEQQSVKVTFTEREKRILISQPNDGDSFVEWRMWAIVNWVLATGNRARTLCSVKIGDLNFSDDEIVIRKTKTNKAMILPMSPALKKVLRTYIRKWRADADEEYYLFPNIMNEFLTSNALRCCFWKYCRNRGVTNTSIHAMRHTFAKDYIRNKGDVFRLQKILGHSTLEMTRRYVNMFDEDLKDDYERYSPLDTLIKPSNRKQSIARTDRWVGICPIYIRR